MNKKMDKEQLRLLAKKCAENCRKAAAYAWKRTRHNFGLKMISVIAAILLCNRTKNVEKLADAFTF